MPRQPVQPTMKAKEMLERLKAGENPGALSAEKWRRALLPCNWDEIKGALAIVHLGGSTCALCEMNYLRDSGARCAECPLDKKGCNCSPGSVWDLTCVAAEEGKRRTFLKHGRALVALLEEIEREEREEGGT